MLYKSGMRKRMSSNAGSGPTALPAVAEELAVCDAERLQRKRLVLWRRPIMTLKYSILEAFVVLFNLGVRLLDRRLLVVLLVLICLYYLPGPHEEYMQLFRQNVGFVSYWIGLGLVSSVGFGTGLHTFLLYLGPHIASVTLAAYECQTLDFPTPPYPEQKICPKEPYLRHLPSIWRIMSKVRIETLLWGVGTALGELPPYFMARTARLSGKCVEEQRELDELEHRSGSINLFNRCKLLVERVVLRIGFFGILLCASVPNPLFDLAGVACGHFLVPFWKFFVATLIGKSLIKASIQQLLVVFAFSEDLVGVLIKALGQVPYLGLKLQAAVQNLLSSTELHMHHKSAQNSGEALGLVARAFQLLAIVIGSYFVISLINALARRHLKRLQEQERELRAEQVQELENRSSANKSLSESSKDAQQSEEGNYETTV